MSAAASKLDTEKFRKVHVMMTGGATPGERSAAKARAEAMAAKAGISLKAAVSSLDEKPKAKPAGFFDGFDDWCEAREPGYKARRAQEDAQRERDALGQGILAGIEGRALRKEEEALAERQKGLWSKLSALGASPGVSPPNFGAGAGYGSATGAISDASATPSGTIDATSALPASFLASVDRVEGGGDYDTLFGHSQKSGPFAGVRVSDMTIGQALDFSDPGGSYGQFVKDKVGRVATPMGRHQIVGTTLRNAAAEMGLDPSTPFNQQTQDGIAAHLARKRVASADTMGGKIMALRSEWEGFKHVPDAELATIVMDLQNGGGMSAPAQSAPVQVASLDPSAGVAQATAPNGRANASVSTMPSTPSDVPAPTPPDDNRLGALPCRLHARDGGRGQRSRHAALSRRHDAGELCHHVG